MALSTGVLVHERRSRRSIRANPSEFTLPALPNAFPYNELLFNGTLATGGLGVKTRSWSWSHRGLTLLYTSSRVEKPVAEAYRLKPSQFPRCALVGAGQLVDVRELTDEERALLVCRFNNIQARPDTLAKIFSDIRSLGLVDRDRSDIPGTIVVEPLPIGFFFRDLRRFKEPVRFIPPRGAISVFRVPLRSVADELREIGFVPSGN